MVPKAFRWDVLEHQNTLMSKLTGLVPTNVMPPPVGMWAISLTLLNGVSFGSVAQIGMLLAPPPEPAVRQKATSVSALEQPVLRT